MKINEIKYSRVFNLGNYENETVSISVFVEENEDATAALKSVKEFVLGRKLTETKVGPGPALPPKTSQDQVSTASNPKPESAQAPKPPVQTKTISEKQLNRLYAIAKKYNYADIEVIRLVGDQLGIDNPSLMRWQDYNKFCKFLESNPKASDEIPF